MVLKIITTKFLVIFKYLHLQKFVWVVWLFYQWEVYVVLVPWWPVLPTDRREEPLSPYRKDGSGSGSIRPWNINKNILKIKKLLISKKSNENSFDFVSLQTSLSNRRELDLRCFSFISPLNIKCYTNFYIHNIKRRILRNKWRISIFFDQSLLIDGFFPIVAGV